MQTGTILKGCYQVLKQLGGTGGFAMVYLVEHTVTKVQYAMKVPLYINTEMDAQFNQEVQLLKDLQKIHHPNLVEYHDDFVENGVHYLVMQLAQGVSLQSLLDKGKRFTEKEAIEISLQVLSALEAAKKVGVIHRDIKPSNIIYDGNNVTLIDFGIARANGGSKGKTVFTVIVARTGYYYAPEQPQFVMAADTRLDIYAVGVTLYELVTGNATNIFPFESFHRLVDPVDPVTSLPGITPALEKVLMKATAAKPANRYQDIPQFIQDLKLAKVIKLACDHSSVDFGRVPWNVPKTVNVSLQVMSGTPVPLTFKAPSWVSQVSVTPTDPLKYPKTVQITAMTRNVNSGICSGDLVISCGNAHDLTIPLRVQFGAAPPNLTFNPSSINVKVDKKLRVYNIMITATNIGGIIGDGSGVVCWEKDLFPVTGQIAVTASGNQLTVTTSLHFSSFWDNTYSNAIVFKAYEGPSGSHGTLIYEGKVPITIHRS